MLTGVPVTAEPTRPLLTALQEPGKRVSGRQILRATAQYDTRFPCNMLRRPQLVETRDGQASRGH